MSSYFYSFNFVLYDLIFKFALCVLLLWAVYILLAVWSIDFIWKMVILTFFNCFHETVQFTFYLCHLWPLLSLLYFSLIFLKFFVQIHILVRSCKSIIWFKFASPYWGHFFPDVQCSPDLCFCVSVCLCWCSIFCLWGEQITHTD